MWTSWLERRSSLLSFWSWSCLTSKFFTCYLSSSMLGFLTNVSLFIYHTDLSLPHIATLQISSLTSCPKHNMNLFFCCCCMLTLSSLPTPSAGALMKKGNCVFKHGLQIRSTVSQCKGVCSFTITRGVRIVHQNAEWNPSTDIETED